MVMSSWSAGGMETLRTRPARAGYGVGPAHCSGLANRTQGVPLLGRRGGRFAAPCGPVFGEHRPVHSLVPVGHAARRESVDDRRADRLPVEVLDPIDEEGELCRIIAEEAVDTVTDDFGETADA